MNIYPDNTVINPKNTPIVISYSQKMDIKKEDLSKIKITLDSSGADLKSFYQEPTITFDDEGTKISYVPKRDALLNIKTTEKITVNVPEFNFVYNEKITIPYGSDTTYTFEINNETLDKVQIEFTSYDNEGKIQFKNTSNYSLDEKIINTFEPNDDYNIVDWQVLYDDNKTAVDPNVISYSISDDKKQISITVLLGSERKIIIKPITVKYAKLLSYSIDEDTTEYINKAVYFTFNQDMTDFDLSFGNKKSVIIQNKILKDLSTYFEISDYIDDGKTVVITPKIIEFKNYLDDNNISEQEIFFTFTENIKKTEKNYKITFKKTDLTNISITYINNLESENPEIKSIDVRRRVDSNNSLDLNFNINDYQYSSDITSDDDKLFYQNHVGNKIYLNISASDFDTGNSGIRRFIVYETLEKDSANKNYFSQYGYKDEIVDYYYYKTIYEGDDIKKEGNNTILQKEIELKTNLDGALKITIAVIDNSNNFITKSFYVILETGKYINFKLFNNVPTEENFYISARNIEDYGKTNFIIDYNKNIRKIFIDFNEINFYSFNSIKNWHEDSDKILVKYSYIDDDNEIITAVLEKLKDDQIKYNEMSKYVEDYEGYIDNWNDEDNASSAQNKYYFEIQNVKDLSNFSFDIILKEDDIYDQKYSFTFPEKVDVYGKSGTELLFDSKNNEIGYIIVNDDYILATSNINKEFPVKIVNNYIHEFDYEDGTYVTLDFTIDNPVYYPVGIFRKLKLVDEDTDSYEKQYYLFGQIDEENPITISSSFGNPELNISPELKKFDLISNGSNSKKLKLEVELLENYWELVNPSSIYLKVQENGDKFFFEKNKTNSTFIFDDTYFAAYEDNEEYNFYLCISKENTIKEKLVKIYNKPNLNFNTHSNNKIEYKNYDCFPPDTISTNKKLQSFIGREYVGCYVGDNTSHIASGIKKIQLFITNNIFDGYNIEYEYYNYYYYYKIPLYDIEDGNYTINFVAYDNSISENYITYSKNVSLLYLPEYEFSKKDKCFTYKLEDFGVQHSELNEKTSKLKGYIIYQNTDFDNISNNVQTFSIRSNDSNYYDCKFTEDYKSENCFIKTYCEYDMGNTNNIIFSTPQYFYIGTKSYSYIGTQVNVKNILSNKEGMLISSDQPVFVQTLVTSKSYDEAKTWSYEQWNKGHPSVSEEVISFSTSSQQIYNIDFDQIPLGYSYVTVVHFADDTIKMGDVYTKERN